MNATDERARQRDQRKAGACEPEDIVLVKVDGLVHAQHALWLAM